jgi:hypothetical protein
MWGLQDDKSGAATAMKRKMLTAAEADALQGDLKKATEDLARTQVCMYACLFVCMFV